MIINWSYLCSHSFEHTWIAKKIAKKNYKYSYLRITTLPPFLILLILHNPMNIGSIPDMRAVSKRPWHVDSKYTQYIQ